MKYIEKILKYFCEDIREKRVFVWSFTTLTPCLRNQHVSIVNDYADTMSA